MLLILGCALALLGLGCTKYVPAKKPPVAATPKVPYLKVASLVTPSALIDPPLPPRDSDQLPFDLPLGKGYGIEGSWTGPNQIKGTTEFQRIGDFTVKLSDGSDVDPKEIAAVLEKWIAASGVQKTQSSGEGGLLRSIGYGTSQTLSPLRRHM